MVRLDHIERMTISISLCCILIGYRILQCRSLTFNPKFDPFIASKVYPNFFSFFPKFKIYLHENLYGSIRLTWVESLWLITDYFLLPAFYTQLLPYLDVSLPIDSGLLTFWVLLLFALVSVQLSPHKDRQEGTLHYRNTFLQSFCF